MLCWYDILGVHSDNTLIVESGLATFMSFNDLCPPHWLSIRLFERHKLMDHHGGEIGGVVLREIQRIGPSQQREK